MGMIEELIKDKYKLRIPPTVYYDLLADVVEIEEEQEPTIKNDLGVDCIVDVLGSYTDLDIPYKREIAENILANLPSVTPQEPNIKALGEELRKVREGIKNKKVLIGFNIAVAICNKHLEESKG